MQAFIIVGVFALIVGNVSNAAVNEPVAGGGRVTYEDPVEQVWKNDPKKCGRHGNCDLKKFFLRTQKWVADLTHQYGPEGYNYGDVAIFGFETTTIEALENYGVVQTARGCVFDSSLVNQELVKTLPYDVPHLGKNVVWKFRDWKVDSVDSDPLYNSPVPTDYPKMNHPSRLGIWRWNLEEGSFDKATEHFFGDKYPPAYPVLYAVDRPNTAFLANSGLWAKNLSIQFKVCLYKLKDIPAHLASGEASQLPRKSIVCKNWASSYVYNWTLRKYESPKDLDPFCKAK